MFGLCVLLMTGIAPGQNSLPPLPRVPAKEPADALRTFQTQHGFRMELLAAEPLVTDPVAMEYDENGRAYVVEMRDYPYTDKTTDKPFVERTTDEPLGRVRLLEDTNGDGIFDRGTIFAEGLSWPTGLALWKGGVFVTATPDVWYLKDTDGDGRADVRLKVLTGFRKFNVQAVMNNLRWGLDHRLYGAGGSNGGMIRSGDQSSVKPVTMSRHDFRFDPRGVTDSVAAVALELQSGGARFGNTFDDHGRRFICNIRNPVQHVLLPSEYLARNPLLPVRTALHDAADAGDTLPVYRTSPPEPWRVINAQRLAGDRTKYSPRSETVAAGYVTSVSGITVYRGTAYPPGFRGQVFLGEVAGNLIHRQKLTPSGVTFSAQRADENVEFVTSTDNWFRPVNFVNAPDGTLHVLDMYRETIEHPWSIPDDIKARLDLESGRDRGRIYRLAPPQFTVPEPPKLGTASTLELVATLENRNSWWRETAHRLLYERQDRTAIEPLRQLLKTSSEELARLHALWSLEGLQTLTEADLMHVLRDSSTVVREQAVRLSESRLTQSEALRRAVHVLADDPAVTVRFQVAFSLGGQLDRVSLAALSRIAARDGDDEWLRTAVLSAVPAAAARILDELLRDEDIVRGRRSQLIVRELAMLVGARAVPEEVARVAASLQPPAADDAARQKASPQAAILQGLGIGLQRAGKKLDSSGAGSEAVTAWLKWAAEMAARSEAEPEARRQAVELLAFADWSQAEAPLRAALATPAPLDVHLAAVRTLSGFRQEAVSQRLLEAWRGLSPAVRSEVVEALLSRVERLPALLDALEAGTIPAAQLPAIRRTQLINHANPDIKARAAKLLLSDQPGPRAAVLVEYQQALKQPGDPARGRLIYQRDCRICHRLGAEGHDAGPRLETIRHRTPQEVLLHVLDPNREVAPQYQEFILLLKDGRSLTGIITTETSTSITLRRAENQTETVLRSAIEEMASSGKSLMPEGLEKKVTIAEMADLLSLLVERAGERGAGAQWHSL